MASGLGIDGLASGMDTTAIIEKLMSLERKPLELAQKKQQDLETRNNAWRDVNTRLNNLQSKVSALQSKTTFLQRKVSLGDEDYFTATASNGAPASTYQVVVEKLAKTHTVSSAVQTSANTSLGYAGTFQVNGKDVTVTAVDTLESIAGKINSTKDVGVNAAVVKLADGQFKLTLTGKETGVKNTITATDGNNILQGLGIFNELGGFANKVQDAEDAVIRVNGLQVSRASNTIEDVISGVTLNLKKLGSTEMTISTDTDAVVKAAREFVEQYNSTMTFINDAMAYNAETKTKGPLFGETSLVYMQSEIRQYLSSTVSGVPTKMNQLALVGISTGDYNQSIEATKSGQLVFNESKMREALKTNFDDVAKLFGATVTNVAAADNGANVSASSQFGPNFPAASIIDGRTDSNDWANGGGWNDNTPGVFPDTVDIQFSGNKTIDSIRVYTLNSEAYPAAQYGVRDLELQYWDNKTSAWKTLEMVTDNTKGMISLEFDPVTTDKVRVIVNEVNGANDYSRLTEVQVMEQNNGVFSNMYDKLRSMTKAKGLIAEKRETLKDDIDDVKDRIEDLNERLEDKEAAYRAKFNAMESALSKIQNQGTWLSQQVSSLPDWNNNKS